MGVLPEKRTKRTRDKLGEIDGVRSNPLLSAESMLSIPSCTLGAVAGDKEGTWPGCQVSVWMGGHFRPREGTACWSDAGKALRHTAQGIDGGLLGHRWMKIFIYQLRNGPIQGLWTQIRSLWTIQLVQLLVSEAEVFLFYSSTLKDVSGSKPC